MVDKGVVEVWLIFGWEIGGWVLLFWRRVDGYCYLRKDEISDIVC